MSLKEVTKKEHILLTKSGNKAILLALKYAKDAGFTTVAFPDQGGWITYKQFAKKLKFTLHEIPTDLCSFSEEEVPDNCALIYNALPAYAFELSLDYQQLKEKQCLVIADTTGTIGFHNIKADLFVASFGEHKLINVGYGGMLASDTPLSFESDFDPSYQKKVAEKVQQLPKRIQHLQEKRSELRKQLHQFPILKREAQALNLIIPFANEQEKEAIEKACAHLPIKYCPMSIKVNRSAISIEVQQL